MKRAPNFDSLAGIYRWMEWITFGPFLHRCRCAFLGEMRSARAALILGDGDGRFTARLLEENSVVLIDAVDLSRRMLLALIARAGIHSGRVRIHPVDARLWLPPNTSYDLVVTHFFLDCLSTAEVAELAARIRTSMSPSARWVVSDFSTPATVFGWLVARPLVTALYFAFWLLTGLRRLRLPNYRQALIDAGFTLDRSHTLLGGLLTSEIWRSTPQLPLLSGITSG